MRRRDSHIIPENGSHNCDTSGVCEFERLVCVTCEHEHELCTLTLPLCVDVLKFDNSYSWIHSKEVYYSVKVLPPNELCGSHETTPTQTVNPARNSSTGKEASEQSGGGGGGGGDD